MCTDNTHLDWVQAMRKQLLRRHRPQHALGQHTGAMTADVAGSLRNQQTWHVAEDSADCQDRSTLRSLLQFTAGPKPQHDARLR
jgi:hypothetical protein